VDFLNIFVRPPGDLLYFLAVIAITQAGLFMALGQRLRKPQERGAQRYTLATMGAVLTWVLLMVGALFALLSDQNSNVVLPPLERAANVVTILLLGWAFLTADHTQRSRLSNVLVLLLLAACIAGYIITGTQWANMSPRIDFNLSLYGIVWTFASVILSLVGMVLMVLQFRLIVDAPLKLVFFLILLLGYGGTLLQASQGTLIGDYAGPARLAFMLALPIVPVVIYRMIVGSLVVATQAPPLPRIVKRATSEAPAIPTQATATTSSPIERESVQLLRVLGLILENSTPTTIPQRIVTASIDVLKADVGALIKLQDANYADIIAAYDKVRGQPISGMALNLDNQPTLVNAMERLAQRPLYPDRNIEELEDFYTRLDINQMGPMYLQPLVNEGSLVAVLAIGLPYVGREMSSGEEELLKGIAVISGSLLSLSIAANEAKLMAEERAIQAIVQGVTPDEIEDAQVIAARQEMEANLALARDQIAQLSRQVMELKIQLDDERSRVVTSLGDTQQGLSISQRMLALNEEHQRLREERDSMAQKLQQAEAALTGATTGDNKAVVQRIIASLEREREGLVAQKEDLEAQIDDMRAKDKVWLPQDVQVLLETIANEKARMEAERDDLESKLVGIQNELKSLGIEGGTSGLVQFVSQLYDERAGLEQTVDMLQGERDTLLRERKSLEDAIQRERERETRIQTLQSELRYLAEDREAAVKQRDKLRSERDEMVAKLDSIKQHRARLLAQAAGYEVELQEAHQEQAKLRVQVQELADERSNLLTERDRLLAENQAVETDRDQLMARFDGDRDRLQQLGEDGIGSLTKMIEEMTEQRNQLERELNQAKTNLAHIENELEMLRVKATGEMQAIPLAKYRPENPDLLMGLVQELRTPMTSITGYVDLLLGESAGILGEMQRKFLQRVHANVTRLASMLDDLVNITELDTGKFVLERSSIDVVNLIEDAITNASNQLREKGLTVKLSLQEDIPLVQADRDAVSQIIGQLLTNAYLVSPPDTEIVVSARRQTVNLVQNGSASVPVDSLLVSVEDRGGGISPEDEARVFARKYKAENPLIEGLGDTGVGLSVARALVEAHGGKLWLETRENVGSIFNFALPLNNALEAEGEG
jgi:signal transduction histidine kinase